MIAALLLSATAAASQDAEGISTRIAETGLAATAASLDGATSASDRPGAGLLPYMQDGERIGSENWWRLQELARSDAALFAAWLN